MIDHPVLLMLSVLSGLCAALTLPGERLKYLCPCLSVLLTVGMILYALAIPLDGDAVLFSLIPPLISAFLRARQAGKETDS